MWGLREWVDCWAERKQKNITLQWHLRQWAYRRNSIFCWCAALHTLAGWSRSRRLGSWGSSHWATSTCPECWKAAWKISYHADGSELAWGADPDSLATPGRESCGIDEWSSDWQAGWWAQSRFSKLRWTNVLLMKVTPCNLLADRLRRCTMSFFLSVFRRLEEAGSCQRERGRLLGTRLSRLGDKSRKRKWVDIMMRLFWLRIQLWDKLKKTMLGCRPSGKCLRALQEPSTSQWTVSSAATHRAAPERMCLERCLGEQAC